MMNEAPHPARFVDDGPHLRLFEVEQRIIGADWNALGVRSSFWRFYQNDADGAALALPGGEWFVLSAQRLYLIPAGVRFSCCGPPVPVSHFYAHFDVIGLPGVLLRALFAAPLGLESEAARGLEETARQLAGAVRAAGRADLLLQCRLKALLYESLALVFAGLPHAQRERWTARSAALDPVRPALDLVEADLAGTLSNARLAGCCHLSPDHFARTFKACVGQTPARYVQERRLTLAAQRLLFSGDSIERIADETGFPNRFYFSRVFTARVGVSPAAYRRCSAARRG
jgi:AraC-like DNA-binding protein